MADLGGLTKTVTSTAGGVAPGVVPDIGSTVPGGAPGVPGAPGGGAPAQDEQANRDAMLGNIADVDLAKGKDLLNVGGEQGKGNINLLTKDPEKKPTTATNTNATNGSGKGDSSDSSGAGPQQDGSKKHSKTCPPSNGIFYAYASQVGTGKKYLLTFSNAKVANEYFEKVAEVHKGDAYRESDQFLTLGPNLSIESATKGVAFNQFQGRMFVQEIDGTQPVIPPQNRKGYIMGTQG
ncbi:hypothetical protein FKW77_006481 [Venturia effusa]|uniref:Uncharacterized protein n=1 Tax=Venturia effusa TaxID=50376 RepID=A0A517LKE2_9PEZI|nr:hypothetical protein FKW77_006481 [Venturia effusa]